jgi:hypothetical protein
MLKEVMTSTRTSSGVVALAVVTFLGLGCLGLGCQRKTLGTAASDPHKLVIVKATWGAIDGEPVEDKTAFVAGMVKDNALDIEASSRVFGDPARFKIKELRVEYAKGGITVKKRLQEGEHLAIAADEKPARARLVVTKAIYGDLASGAVADVTQKVDDLVKDNSLSITPTNPLLGDPAPLKEKQLRVEFTFDGKARSKVVAEKETLTISRDGQ